MCRRVSYFASDLALASDAYQHVSSQVGLKISEKTKVMMLNVPNLSPVKVEGEDLPTTEKLTYLCSTGSTRPGTPSEC